MFNAQDNPDSNETRILNLENDVARLQQTIRDITSSNINRDQSAAIDQLVNKIKQIENQIDEVNKASNSKFEERLSNLKNQISQNQDLSNINAKKSNPIWLYSELNSKFVKYGNEIIEYKEDRVWAKFSVVETRNGEVSAYDSSRKMFIKLNNTGAYWSNDKNNIDKLFAKGKWKIAPQIHMD